MTRELLPADRVDASIRDQVNTDYADTLQEVRNAVDTQPIVVIGMEYNPHVARARKALDKAGIAYTYLGYGGYTREWRRRTAIKMWSGWHTFPQVFVKGSLVGGASELIRLIESGELQKRI